MLEINTENFGTSHYKTDVGFAPSGSYTKIQIFEVHSSEI